MGRVESVRISSLLSSASLLILLCVQEILVRIPFLLSTLLFIMAVFVSPSRMDRIKEFFSRRVQDGENPRKLFLLPVYIRKDGCVIRVGSIVQVEEKPETKPSLHCVKDILISQDLNQTLCCLVPVICEEDMLTTVMQGEELMVEIETVLPVSERGVVLDMLRDGMEILKETIQTYPIHMQRVVRRHQLCSTIRRDVQRFLSGFSIVHSWTVGAVDWRLDPGILGLEKDTGFSVDFHIEKFENSVSHLDLLFGNYWDVRCIPGTAGYRAIITLDLGVDQYHDIKIKAHAVLCSEALNPENHRNKTLIELHTSNLNPMLKGLLSTENTLNRPETSYPPGTARSLAWESFRNSQESSLSSADESPVKGAVYQAVSLDSSFTLPSSSVAAESLQELLRKTDLNSQNFYYYSPIQNKKRGSGRRRSKVPNTSTPADEIEGTDTEDFRDRSMEILNSEIPVFEELTPLTGIGATPDTTISSGGSHETGSTVEDNSLELNLDQSTGTLVTNPQHEYILEQPDLYSIPGIKAVTSMRISTPSDPESDQPPDLEPIVNPNQTNHVERNRIDQLKLKKTNQPGDTHVSHPTNQLGDQLESNSAQPDNQLGFKVESNPTKQPGDQMESNQTNQPRDQLESKPAHPANLPGDQLTRSSSGSVDRRGCDHPDFSGDAVPKLIDPRIANDLEPRESEINFHIITEDIKSAESTEPTSSELKSPILVEDGNTPDTNLNASNISDLENNNDLSLEIKMSETLVSECLDSPAISPTPGAVDSKVAEYLNSLPSHVQPSSSHTPDKLDLSLNLSTPRQQGSPAGFKSPMFNESRRGRMNSEDEANISVCSSRSRASDLGSMGGRFGQGTLSTFYGVGIPATNTCPFPDEWQYNTIPEVIENDDEID